MIVNTKYHGIREYKDEDIITFKKGLPGFEDLRSFILFPVEENEFFSVLHSVEQKDIGFVVMSPFSIYKDYEFKLDDNLIGELRIAGEKDVLVLNTVTLNSNVKKITVNLKAPILVNVRERIGEQIILDKEEYLIKYPLIQE